MDEALSTGWMAADQDRRISEAVERDQGRLRNFIRRRVADAQDAEDVLQDVLYALVEAERLMTPIEQIGAWLFRVARNRIVDLFRRRRLEPPPVAWHRDPDSSDELLSLEDLLPSAEDGPDEAYARSVLIEELEAALDELPEEQRAVFVAHEIEGRSFRELAAETGLSLNTLLSRKRYAVLRLRARLRDIYDEFAQR
jgi:RNA polymerase sigma factor (sigma-70 family)